MSLLATVAFTPVIVNHDLLYFSLAEFGPFDTFLPVFVAVFCGSPSVCIGVCHYIISIPYAFAALFKIDFSLRLPAFCTRQTARPWWSGTTICASPLRDSSPI